ncbi:MAG: pilin [Thiomargarita sp.]|nr:pilin [Thiomargarita sp.]
MKFNFFIINRQQDFWLLEFFISIFIISLCSAIAITYYQSYLINAKVAEVIGLTTGVKVNITEFYSYYGYFPANSNQVDFKTSGEYTSNITINNGAITGQLKQEDLKGSSLTIRPILSNSNLPKVMQWTCGYAQPPTNFTAQGENKTDISPKYLPSVCR